MDQYAAGGGDRLSNGFEKPLRPPVQEHADRDENQVVNGQMIAASAPVGAVRNAFIR